ncbi:MAG: hypothetical protein NWF13_08465 [Candidatus Bathyarchaeota archaeon]|nr:hypothetical protein [Candidatus Bathyarchaeota archaeon]
MAEDERIQPVHVIITKQEMTLRSLLQSNNLLDLVKRGNTIVLSEGKSLTDLDLLVPPGKKLAVISFEVLGGG